MLGTLDRHTIDEVLDQGTVGRLGLISHGRPYVVPITYAYRDGAIIGHSAAGEKLDALRAATSVCFEVDEVDDLRNWRSVIAWGHYEELTGEAAAEALGHLVAAVAPVLAVSAGAHGGPHAAEPHGQAPSEAVIYRLVLQEVEGRFEAAN